MCLGNALHGSQAIWCWWDNRVVSSVTELMFMLAKLNLSLAKSFLISCLSVSSAVCPASQQLFATCSGEGITCRYGMLT